MNFAFSLCPECLTGFRALRFDATAPQASNQIPFNSIIWRDEYLPLETMPNRREHPSCMGSLMRLFYARKTLWQTGHLPDELVAFWQQAQATLPDWPGFQRLSLTREDAAALRFCEEETNDLVGELRGNASVFALTDEGGGVVSFISHPSADCPPPKPME